MNEKKTKALFREVQKKYLQPEELVEWSRMVEEGLTLYEKYYIEKYLPSRSLLLNVGCGGGRESISLAEIGYKMIGIDLVYPMVQQAHQNAVNRNLDIKYSTMNALSLGFRENTFTGVVMLGQVLAFIPYKRNRISALKEIGRVLKPNGRLILTTHSRNCHIKYELYFLVINTIRKIFNTLGIDTLETGDRFASTVGKAKSDGKHFLHMYSMEEAIEDLSSAGFEILKCNSRREIIEKQENPKERKRDYYLIYAAEKL